jgi:hypothetical protein
MPNFSSSSTASNCRLSDLTLSKRIAKPCLRPAKYASNSCFEVQVATPYSFQMRETGNFNTCLIRAHPTTALTGLDLTMKNFGRIDRSNTHENVPPKLGYSVHRVFLRTSAIKSAQEPKAKSLL